MYDELVKRLRWCASYDPRIVIQDCNEAADAIEDLQKQLQKSEADNINLTGWLAEEHAKHQWIPVEERLPEENGDYIVYCIGGNYNQTSCISLAYWSGKYFYGDNLLSVTHWMPLPDPPKGDE